MMLLIVHKEERRGAINCTVHKKCMNVINRIKSVEECLQSLIISKSPTEMTSENRIIDDRIERV